MKISVQFLNFFCLDNGFGLTAVDNLNVAGAVGTPYIRITAIGPLFHFGFYCNDTMKKLLKLNVSIHFLNFFVLTTVSA